MESLPVPTRTEQTYMQLTLNQNTDFKIKQIFEFNPYSVIYLYNKVRSIVCTATRTANSFA